MYLTGGRVDNMGFLSSTDQTVRMLAPAVQMHYKSVSACLPIS